MGILNITPDSFSDGGRFIGLNDALVQAKKMVEDGVDIIDIGGESTRPGAEPVTYEQEVARIIPVIKELKQQNDIPISVDTYRASTAKAALSAGADMVNDVWGLKNDPDMAKVIAEHDVPVCIMHNSYTTEYESLMEDVLKGLGQSIEIALKSGIKEQNIIVDPGIGFGKTWEQNLDIMIELDKIKDFGYPLLLGTSRKSFIGRVLGLPVDERLEGTLATSVFGIIKGVDVLRVHDVMQNKRVAIMTDRMVRGEWTE
jgi:dihydropteroate synthase